MSGDNVATSARGSVSYADSRGAVACIVRIGKSDARNTVFALAYALHSIVGALSRHWPIPRDVTPRNEVFNMAV
ncbi:unnamed protein product, partial [Iphiclides podalirius]